MNETILLFPGERKSSNNRYKTLVQRKEYNKKDGNFLVHNTKLDISYNNIKTNKLQ